MEEKEKKIVWVEDKFGGICDYSLPAQANEHAAGYDVHPIEVQLISHSGLHFTCRTPEEVKKACKDLKKIDKRSMWRRIKDWFKDEIPQKGWKQLWFNTGLKLAPEDVELYISLEPCSRTVKTDYVLHNSLGTIDNDYRGFCYAIYHSVCQTYDEDSIIRLLNTCCQLKGKMSIPLEFRKKDKLSETARGTGGFGSTEKKN